MNLRIAVDVTVPRAAREILKQNGYEIVARALEGEEDDIWLFRAFSEKADVVVTEDRQAQVTARRLGMHPIDPVGRGSGLITSLLADLDAVKEEFGV